MSTDISAGSEPCRVKLNYGIPSEDQTFDATVLVGTKDCVKNLLTKNVLDADSTILDAMLKNIGSSGSATSFFSKGEGVHRVSLGVVADKVSRNNHPMSPHELSGLISSTCGKGANVRLLIAIKDKDDSGKSIPPAPMATAVAKAFPIFNRKTKSKQEGDDEPESRTLHVTFLDASGEAYGTDTGVYSSAQALSEGVRLASRMSDTHPEEMTTTAVSKECQAVCEALGDSVTMTEICGDDLKEQGYGGIHGVGKAATCPPRLIKLEYVPASASDESTIALVGKGIVYDTGGLALKPKTGMCEMKHDMGGAAGLLGAFYAAVKLQVPQRITLLLCVAENAIGPVAFRNDDILTLYSGKTVEINNSDAEGRLVLGDGVAHATKHIPNLKLVMDMATLTGAQMVCTGQKHASALSNTLEWEQKAQKAGMVSGDLCYPILYAPELLMKEFNSKVADMKNSVKDRSNAQTSCAGHFIESHLNPDYKGGWLHIDMAGPSTSDSRATGYGVGLVLALLEAPGFTSS